MNEIIKICILAIVIFIVDLPWLLFQQKWVKSIIEDIQEGREMYTRAWAGVPVYIALAYLVTQAHSAPRAALMGICVYAVYDFTQIFTFDKYPIEFAVADTLWGGLLMAFIWWIGSRNQLTSAV
jgi:uncharacterized membrane protein